MDLSFIPTIFLACGLTMFLLIWWNKRHRIKFQPYSYNPQNEEEPLNNKSIVNNLTAQEAIENLSSSPPLTSDEEYPDELYFMDTPNVDHKKTSEKDKEEQLKILLEEQDYLEDLAGRETISKINARDIIKTFFQNQTVKIVLLIIGALALFAGLVALTIIAGKYSWFG